MNLIHYMQYIIETDRTIRDILSYEEDEWTGIKYPAVAYEEAPEYFQAPYLIIRDELSMITEETHETRRIVRFECIAKKPIDAKRVATRLEQLFTRRNMYPMAVIALPYGRYPMPSEPKVYGEIVSFQIRVHRQDLQTLEDALPEVYAYFKIKTERGF